MASTFEPPDEIAPEPIPSETVDRNTFGFTPDQWDAMGPQESQRIAPPSSPPYYRPQNIYLPPLSTPTSGLATAALICGLATFVTLGLTAIPAVICGHLALKMTKTGQHTGNGMAVTGLILGYLAIAGWSIFIVAALITGAASQGS